MKGIFLTGLMTLSSAIAHGVDGPPLRIHTTAVTLRALNKITARVTQLDVPISKTITFGNLDITARHCAKNPPEDPPESVAFLTIQEKKERGHMTPVFSGWMFSSAPAVSAMEHPVYDVWVVSCSGSDRVPVLENNGDERAVANDDPDPKPHSLSDDDALDGFLDGFSKETP